MSLEEVRARVDAATPGPWHVDGPEFGGLWVTAYRDGPSIAGGQPVHPAHKDQSFAVIAGLGEADAAFIANARSDVPYLLDRIARLEAALDLHNQTPTGQRRKCLPNCIACALLAPARAALDELG